MLIFRQYPWFGAVLVLLGLALTAEIGAICERRSALRRLEAQLDRRRREWKKLAATTPAPTPENARVIEADVARGNSALAATEAECRGGNPGMDPSQMPAAVATRTDVFFALADFVEKARQRAVRLGVVLGLDERFGFSAYANEGPDPRVIPAVQRQRAIIEYLAAALLEARPQQLLAIQRERPDGAAGTPAGAMGPGMRDLFAIERTASARARGLVDTTAFRLVFTGQTAALRKLLNKLAGFDLPILVRGIEVEPASAAETGSSPGRDALVSPAIGTALPLVMTKLSKFTVTVEFIELVPAGPVP